MARWRSACSRTRAGKYGLQAFDGHESMSGREIRYQQLPIEEIRKGSEDFALMLEWFDRVGYDADIEGNGREFDIAPTKFRDWAARQDWEPAGD